MTRLSTLDSITTNSNTEPSGPVILLNTIKSGTLLATSNMQPTPSNDFITVILRNQDGVTTIETENNSNLPTQEEVRKEEKEWKESIERANKNEEENNHASMSWTACYDDECLVNMSEKSGGWFPKEPKQQPPTAPHADLPRDKCTRWGCQVPAHKTGRKSRTTSTKRGGKKSKKPQIVNWDDTDSTVPDTTEMLQEKLAKAIKEQWELKEALKEQQVQIERLTRDLNKLQFEVARQRGIASLAQRNARGAILQNIEFHRKLDEIHQASKAPERVSEDQIFIASMSWHTE